MCLLYLLSRLSGQITSTKKSLLSAALSAVQPSLTAMLLSSSSCKSSRSWQDIEQHHRQNTSKLLFTITTLSANHYGSKAA